MDLEGVDPKRRDEITRRVAILDRYLAIDLADAAEDAAFAAELGVGVAQFLRLARIWREGRRPDLLPGARRRKVGGRATKADDVPPAGAAASGRIVVDDVAVDLPVRMPAARSLPIMHAVVDEAGGAPIAWSLGTGRVDAASAATLLLRLPPAARVIDAVSLPSALSGGVLAGALSRAGIAVSIRTPSGRLGADVRRLVGQRIGGIALRSRATLRADAGASNGLGRIDMEEALRILHDAIGSPRTDAAASSLPFGARGERLRLELARIAEAAA